MPNINFRVTDAEMGILVTARKKRKQSWSELFIGLLPVEEQKAPAQTEQAPPTQ